MVRVKVLHSKLDMTGLMQELVEIVGRSTGIALMAPPTDNDAAQKTLNTLLSAVNKKQKVQPSWLFVECYVLRAGVQFAMFAYTNFFGIASALYSSCHIV